MGAWEAVRYVGTGLSLIAFVAAAILFAYRAKLKAHENIIRSAPPGKRVEAISAVAETFNIDLSELNAKQRGEAVLAEIARRSRKDAINAAVAVAVGLMLCGVAVFAILQPKAAEGNGAGSAPKGPAVATKAPPENIKPVPIPPGRLVGAKPFRGRLDDCPTERCDFDFILRGYDERNRLRYDKTKHFSGVVPGAFFNTDMDTDDTLYLEAGPAPSPSGSITFRLFCRFNKKIYPSDELVIQWSEFSEAMQSFAVWPVCEGDNFKASIGIGVNVATSRVHQPGLKQDPGRPR